MKFFGKFIWGLEESQYFQRIFVPYIYYKIFLYFLAYLWCSAHGNFRGISITDIQRNLTA